MSLLEVQNLSHRYGDKPLYQNASFELFKAAHGGDFSDHLGVVGPNGTGKSTLIKILTGEIIPDTGWIHWQNGCRIGHMSQYAEADGTLTVIQYLKTAFQALYQQELEMLHLYDCYATQNSEDLLHQAAGYQEDLERNGFYEIDSRIAKMAEGLGLTAYGMDTPVGTLSGGQRAKVILAQLLLKQADILLLDEPTNFLDREHVDWLSGFLATFPGAFIVVSHDYEFLERITNCILDIEFESIRKYHGRYTDYLRQKAQLREDYLRQYSAQQKKIEITEAFIRKNKAGVNSKMARGRQKQLDRLERLAPPGFQGKPSFRFQELPSSSAAPLKAKKLLIGYEQPLLPELDFSVLPGQKLVITGFNGIGKSTLLKTLLGLLPPLGGDFRLADTVKAAYYEQEFAWENDKLTPLEILAEAYPRMSPDSFRRQLAQCGVKAEHFSQSICTLSGGEQSKVKLCRLLLSPTNFLVLDEPTNHLDDTSKEVLAEALRNFSGSVLLVTHEERFYRDWADRVLNIGK